MKTAIMADHSIDAHTSEAPMVHHMRSVTKNQCHIRRIGIFTKDTINENTTKSEIMDGHTKWMTMETMSREDEKAIQMKRMKIHRISVCDQKRLKNTFMSAKSIALTVIARNRSRVAADDGNHWAVVVICVAVLIIESVIHQLIESDRCEKPIKIKDPTRRNMNQIRMQMRPFIGYHRPKLGAYIEDREKAVDHLLGMAKVINY